MVRRSLIAVALFAVAAPLAAQSPVAQPEEWTWSLNRPDALAPIGVFGARAMEKGELQVSYRYQQTNWEGTYYQTDSLPLLDVLVLYDDAPITRRDLRHRVRVEYGITDRLSLLARGEWAVIQRQTFSNGAPIRVGIESLGDVELGVLYQAYAQGPYRMILQGGAIIPTGHAVTYADTTRAGVGPDVVLPYDMRPGGGTFAAIGGVTGTVQNEVGSLGIQFRVRADFGMNGVGSTPDARGYRLGQQYEANGWAAYKVNSVFSVSAGVRWENWRQIEGSDDRLYTFGDPHNWASQLSGQRAHMPLGVNMLMPGNSVLAGHRIGAEMVYTLHHNYDAPQMGMDWGFNLGYFISF